MAAPNLIGATTINGKTTGANLTSTSATTVLNNASGSGKYLTTDGATASWATVSSSGGASNARLTGYNLVFGG